MDRLKSLALLLRIVEKGGLAAGGKDFGLSPASVTERVAALEQYYGAALLNRTTRSLSLTEEGQLLVAGARPLLDAAEELESRVRFGASQLSGNIRISLPEDIGRHRVIPILDEFLVQHPNIRLDVHLSDGFVDLAKSGFDIALRFGDLKDSSLKAKRLATTQRVACASPEYLEQHGYPLTPNELTKHNCLLMRFGHVVDKQWLFQVDGEVVPITVSGNRMANNGAVVRDWCLAGVGIALKSDLDVAGDLAAGRLLPVLSEFAIQSSNLQLVYASSSAPTARLRALINYLSNRFSAI